MRNFNFSLTIIAFPPMLLVGTSANGQKVAIKNSLRELKKHLESL